MSLLPKSSDLFSDKTYWDSFFTQRKSSFEWYGGYSELCEILHKYVKIADKILVPGCGNSELSACLYDVGFRKIVSIDLCPVVINQMKRKHSKTRPCMEFSMMDVCNMTFEDESFSCIIDKGTLDALFSSDNDRAKHLISSMLSEFNRVLKLGGRYICVSLLQPFILKFVLGWFTTQGWMIRIHRCLAAEKKTRSQNQVVLPVFVLIATKLKLLSDSQTIMELALGNAKPTRYQSKTEISTVIFDLQQYMRMSEYGRRTLCHEEGLAVDLVGRDGNVRYILHVADRSKKFARTFAVFIVPEGRETEWIFGTHKGRVKLCQLSNVDRLLVVHLQRKETYENLSAVKTELEPYVTDFSPQGLDPNYKIPFLSLADDLGSRNILYEGNSSFSGDYIIEDVVGKLGLESRRLVFKNNQCVIQSEAMLHSQDGNKQVNQSFLCCAHHRYMLLGLGFVDPEVTPIKVSIIGLGGGGLASFLKTEFKQCSTQVIEIDGEILNVAKAWFGFKENDRLKVTIGDGLEWVSKSEPGAYHLLMIDADSKDNSIGISCPPESFLDPSWLAEAFNALCDTGVLVLNLVCRDEVKRKEVIVDLKKCFPFIYFCVVENEVGQILFCCKQQWDFGQEIAAAKENTNCLKYNSSVFQRHKITSRNKDTIVVLRKKVDAKTFHAL